MRVPDDVSGDNRVLCVLDDVGQRSLGRLFDGTVDILDSHIVLQLDHEIDGRTVGHGNSHGHTVELAFEFREHLADRLGCPGRRRDDVLGGCPAPPQVLVGDVGEPLVVGVGVNRCHDTLSNAEGVVEHLCQWSQAIGRAGGVGDDDVAAVQIIVVDTQYDSLIDFILRRHCQDNSLGSGFEMLLEGLSVPENPCCLDDHVDSQLGPGKFGGVRLDEHFYLVVPNLHLPVAYFDLLIEAAHHRVVLEQVGEDVVVREVVDGHDFDARVRPRGDDPENGPPDATESIDCNLHIRNLRSVALRSWRTPPPRDASNPSRC